MQWKEGEVIKFTVDCVRFGENCSSCGCGASLCDFRDNRVMAWFANGLKILCFVTASNSGSVHAHLRCGGTARYPLYAYGRLTKCVKSIRSVVYSYVRRINIVGEVFVNYR